jgi:hypothetical protein
MNMSSKIVFGRKGGQFNKVGFFGMLTNLWASKNLPFTEKKMRTNSVIIFKGRHEYNNTKCHTRCSNNVLALKSDSTHNFFSQGHYGFHSFPVVDWFCLFICLYNSYYSEDRTPMMIQHHLVIIYTTWNDI